MSDLKKTKGWGAARRHLAGVAAVLTIMMLSQGAGPLGSGAPARLAAESPSAGAPGGADPQACRACLRAFDLDACHRAAVDLAARGRLDQALVLESMVQQRDPGNPEFAAALGAMFHGARDLPRSIEMYHTALAVSSGYPKALIGLGAIMHERGESEIAARYYGRAVRENPGVPAYKIALAEVLVEGGRLRDARPLLMEVVKRWPESREAALAQRMMSRTALAGP
ncbi:MAG: tetratricopeptide repeat protein [Acidobacteriota bacterium]